MPEVQSAETGTTPVAPPSHWRLVSLGDYAEVTKGVSYKGAHLNEPGPLLLGLGEFSPGGGAKLDKVRTYGGDYRERHVVRAGDLLLALTDLTQSGSVLGSPMIVPSGKGEFCLYTHHVGRVALHDPESTNASFLRYVLQDFAFSAFVSGRATGTTVRAVHPREVAQFEFALPPLEEQRAIARVLGALDDKIELNRRMSETLEEMARALFRLWFVDFDPVRAKAEGRPSGLPPDLDALFPASFEASELGEIPAGWEVIPAGEAMTVHGGSTPSTKEPAYWGGDHCFATPKDLSKLQEPILASTARRLTDVGIARIRSGLLPPGTVLLSSRAPIGYLAMTETPVTINQGIVAMVCDGRLGRPTRCTGHARTWTPSKREPAAPPSPRSASPRSARSRFSFRPNPLTPLGSRLLPRSTTS